MTRKSGFYCKIFCGFQCNPNEYDLPQCIEDLVVQCDSQDAQRSRAANHALFLAAKAITKIDANKLEQAVLALLNALKMENATTRETALTGFDTIVEKLQEFQANAKIQRQLQLRLYISCHDTNEHNQEVADRLWKELKLGVDEKLLSGLVDDIQLPSEAMRVSVAAALADLARACPKLPMLEVFDQLWTIYKVHLPDLTPPVDDFGRVLSDHIPDPWEARAGVAMAIEKLVTAMPGQHLRQLFERLVSDGIQDRHETVRHLMLQAALAAIKEHGKDQVRL